MNLTKLIFSQIDPFKVVSVDNQADFVNIYVQSRQKICRCPDCLSPSKKLHSYYLRKFRDLPTFGKSCNIYLQSRKYRCLRTECKRKIFTERFDDHFKPCKRRTKRLDEKLLATALEMGGRPAERICNTLSMPVSDSTLLRLIHKTPLPPLGQLKAVGVDDWAYKKRDRYGSILVNLDTGKVIDLLPDREEKTLTSWLQGQHAIEVITRDRYGKYMRAATKGAPQAIQVTDRWHLLKNLGEAVKRIMVREYTRLSRAVAPKTVQKPLVVPKDFPAGKKLAATDGVIKQRFDEMKKLQAKGLSNNAIAKSLGMHRDTVRKYLSMDVLMRKSYGERGMIEAHFEYIKERMKSDPNIHLKTLWTELKQKGYPGAYSTLSESLTYYDIRVGKKARQTKLPQHAGSFFKPSAAAMAFLAPESKISSTQKKLISKLCQSSPELKHTMSLVKKFRELIENKMGSELNAWIAEAKHSVIAELKSFATGLLSDLQSIENAINLHWSNGPVEGNVNKLKTIKRQMYGRASFDLLRKRLVLAPD